MSILTGQARGFPPSSLRESTNPRGNPGGHVDENEDPAQAVLREINEETGIACEIVPDERFVHQSENVNTLARPFAILQEDVPEGGETVQHIDFIYVLRPLTDPDRIVPQDGEVTGAKWVPIAEVRNLPTPHELPDLIEAAALELAQS